MRKRYSWLAGIFLIVLSLLLTSCDTSSTVTTSTSTTSTSTSKTTSTTTTTTSVTSTSTSSTSSTSTAANWWDEWGEPVYGGTINIGRAAYTGSWDVWSYIGGEPQLQYETLFVWDCTTDRDEWAFQSEFVPDQYYVGNLIESWEQTDANTIILHVREGIHWANKPPVNGREFTAYDIEEHYDRVMGTGHGYTQASPYSTDSAAFFEKFTATDKYTVRVDLTRPSALAFNTLALTNVFNHIEAPECVAEGEGSITDWKRSIGTGAYILEDYVSDSLVKWTKNPDYWCYDARYPENKLPYADTVKYFIIPEISTRISAIRTGKIDLLGEGENDLINVDQAAGLRENSPELIEGIYTMAGPCLELRCDHEPFTDIRVRKALQMAVDLESIANDYYQGTVEATPVGIFNPVVGCAFEYADWPQELKDEYSYNPEEAKRLLAEAGYAGGFDTNVVMATNQDVQMVEILKSQLAVIGVNMEIRTMDLGVMRAFTGAGKQDQMSLDACANPFAPMPVFRARITGGSSNRVYNNDPEFDALYQQCLAASDMDEVMEIAREADRMCIENHWTVNTLAKVQFNYWQPSLKGYDAELLRWGLWQVVIRMWKAE